MHAAINEAVNVFTYLLPIEIDDKTTEYNEILAPSISNLSQITIAPGTNIIMIIMISNSYQCLKNYIKYIRSINYNVYDVPEGAQNDDGLSAFHIAGIV